MSGKLISAKGMQPLAVALEAIASDGGSKSILNRWRIIHERACENLPKFEQGLRMLRSPLTVVRWYKEALSIAPRQARRLILSSELFSSNILSASGRQAVALRSLLLCVGIQNVTAVFVERTPKIAKLLSEYHELHLGRFWRGFSELTTFDEFVDQQIRSQRVLTPPTQTLQTWIAAGFRLFLVSSENAEYNGLDETDVLACEVLGLPCLNHAWPFRLSSKADFVNARPKVRFFPFPCLSR